VVGEAGLEPSDEILVRDTLSGSLGAFEQLMARYEKLVCRIALGYVGSKDNALDVTQEVFLKVYRALDRATAPGMFKPWLLRITCNESVNWLRRNRRHAADEPLDLGRHEARGESDGNPEQRVLADEQRRRVLGAFGALNPKYRLAVALRYAEGLRLREIADVMQCSEGVVKSMLFRGVRQLRERVAGDG